jgi:hypothetical protein
VTSPHAYHECPTVVPRGMAEAQAQESGARFIEASVKDDVNVEAAFLTLVTQVDAAAFRMYSSSTLAS